ncbi:MAG: FAD-dependent oxidoreductase, partial [Clostridia bacterium]|nr:FAD-dependent oxidoreductase [Clostridia bacterium]
MLEKKYYEADLAVIGGGMAGICTAIRAAREGLKVVLMHERPVFGGNASSEVRMWICGSKGKDCRETGILEEIALENLYRNPTKNYAIWDTVLYDFVKREENITPLLNCTCMDAETEDGDFGHGRTKKIVSVTGYQMTTQRFCVVKAEFFADCSGDSILAPLTGAAFRTGREGKEVYGESLTREKSDDLTMGSSCLIQAVEGNRPVKYTPPKWSAKLTAEDFKHRLSDLKYDYENFWYLELGGNKNTISDAEEIKDELIALAAGTWDHVKNSGLYDSENWDLGFLGF